MSKLLVVDDEQAICWGVAQVGRQMGHEVLTASSAEQALELAARERPNLIVLDVRLPGMNGLEAMEALQALLGPTPIIVITAYGDLETAVGAVRQGAREYIIKPFNAEQIQQAIQRTLTPQQGSLLAGDATPTAVAGFIGQSPLMQEVYSRIALAAASDVPVLLLGESGAGKELAARAIHQYSLRSAGPFVVVNLATLSPALAESELFGHVRGAFTGADQPRRGLLAQARGGTLFLDEVADIPLPAQVKLLRALEQGEILPVGADEPVRIDFRLVSATHQDLPRLVQCEEFRHDLYFRLAAFQIRLPALRERPEDIGPLAKSFLQHFSGSAHPKPHFSQEALSVLRARPWKGNVRELRNAIHHAIVLARGGVILPAHLPPAEHMLALTAGNDRTDAEGADELQTLERQLHELVARWTELQLQQSEHADQLHDQILAVIEPSLLNALLRHHGGSAAAVARSAGLHRTTVRRKLDQYRLEDNGPSRRE